MEATAALGITLTGARNYREVVGLLRQVLETRAKELGVNHPTTLHMVTILGFGRNGSFQWHKLAPQGFGGERKAQWPDLDL